MQVFILKQYFSVPKISKSSVKIGLIFLILTIYNVNDRKNVL